MGKVLIAVVCAALVGAASPSAAGATGDPEAEEQARLGVRDDRRFAWRHMTPGLGWRWSDSFQEYAGSVSIFFVHTAQGAASGRPTRLAFVARRVERHTGQPDTVRWADSDRCPALMDRVRDFETLRAPPTVIPGLRWPPEFPVIVVDGVIWTLWSRSAQQAGRMPALVEMSSNAGAIAEWGRASREALAGCWSEVEPSF